jgi:transposase
MRAIRISRLRLKFFVKPPITRQRGFMLAAWLMLDSTILGLPGPFTILEIHKSRHDWRYHIVPSLVDIVCPGNCPEKNAKGRSNVQRRKCKSAERWLPYSDIPQQGYRVILMIFRVQFRCGNCGRIFYLPLPFIDPKRRMTIRLKDYIIREVPKRTFASVADDLGLDEKTVRNVFCDRVQSSTRRPEAPVYLGIDEVHFRNDYRRSSASNTGKKKGQQVFKSPPPAVPKEEQFLCVLTDIKARTLLDLLRYRSAKSVEGYLNRMPRKGTVEVVSIDMHKPYLNAVRSALPNAKVVIDKFHVVKLADTAMNSVRISRKKKIGFIQADTEIIAKRERELNDFERLRLQTWQLNAPRLYDAYMFKELFHDIYDQKTQARALMAYERWRLFFEASTLKNLKKFLSVSNIVQEWHQEIFEYFNHPPVTNAFTEATNGIIKLINRTGRGHSFKMLWGKVIGQQGISPQLRKAPKVNKRGVYPEVVTLEGLAAEFSTELEELKGEHRIPPLDKDFVKFID